KRRLTSDFFQRAIRPRLNVELPFFSLAAIIQGMGEPAFPSSLQTPVDSLAFVTYGKAHMIIGASKLACLSRQPCVWRCDCTIASKVIFSCSFWYLLEACA